MNKAPIDRSKTLDDLDPPAWGPPEFPSHLVTTCHRLRAKPLDQFDEENLRIMIGQEINLEYLVPMALEVLHKDPLASGDYYDGDLLQNVLRIDGEWWQANPDRVPAVRSLIARLADPQVAQYLSDPDTFLAEEIATFNANTAGIAG